MNVDQLVRHLGSCRRRLKVLRDDNQRLRDSRDEWKRKHTAATYEIQILRKAVRRARQQRDDRIRGDNPRLSQSRDEWKRKHSEQTRQNTALRRRVRQLQKSRDLWKARVPRPRPSRLKEPNVLLTERDLRRIMEIPARD